MGLSLQEVEVDSFRGKVEHLISSKAPDVFPFPFLFFLISFRISNPQVQAEAPVQAKTMTEQERAEAIKRQVEYYFSRHNLLQVRSSWALYMVKNSTSQSLLALCFVSFNSRFII